MSKIPIGYKKTEIGIVCEDWIMKPLSVISAFITKGSTPTTYGFKWEQNGILFLRSECVSNSGLDLTQSMYISEEAHKVLSRSEIKSNDILITITGNVGRVIYLEKDFGVGNINQHIAKVRIVNDNIDSYYIYHYLSQPAYRKYFNSIVTGQAYPQISLKQVREAIIPLPSSKSEQTAIATALSDTDALISGVEKLIAKKRNIKQGAMQKLLQPKKDWKLKKLGELAKVGRGRVISHKEIDLAIEKKYPVYSSQTSNNGVMGYLDSYDFDGEYVTWTTDGENAGTVFYRNGKFNCTNVCGTIKLIKDNPRFISILLNTITSKHVSRNLANPKLMNDPMKKIEIALPLFEEQTHIANILTDMDAEITALEAKLEKYRMVKLGMMQNLLTGKIRLV